MLQVIFNQIDTNFHQLDPKVTADCRSHIKCYDFISHHSKMSNKKKEKFKFSVLSLFFLIDRNLSHA